MDSSMLVRVVCGILAVVILAVIIRRRTRKALR